MSTTTTTWKYALGDRVTLTNGNPGVVDQRISSMGHDGREKRTLRVQMDDGPARDPWYVKTLEDKVRPA